jgi:RNA polymerase sigma-70 factor (ECF subfamily)
MRDAPSPEGGHAQEAAEFEALRPLLFGIAYRMLASVADAEDVVQDAYLRYARAVEEGTRIDSLKAWLAAVTTRLSIDHLRSARVRREEYVGLWLPEPLVTDNFTDAPGVEGESDSLSTAFLVLLERLNPVERAVFLLHDVFGYPHDAVSQMVGKTESNTRKIASRARRSVQSGRKVSTATRGERQQLASRFFAAMTSGDVAGLAGFLAEDVVLCGDGGGKAPQWTKPIEGVVNVSRALGGVGRQVTERGGYLELRQINGEPGAIVRTGVGDIISVFALEVVDGRIVVLRSVINPDKLRHLGRVADVRALLAGRSTSR